MPYGQKIVHEVYTDGAGERGQRERPEGGAEAGGIGEAVEGVEVELWDQR